MPRLLTPTKSAIQGAVRECRLVRRSRTCMSQIDLSSPVLLVEQRASVIEIISDLLRSIGYAEIEAACNAPAALDILGAKGPRLVISDLHMEPVNGLQLLRTIRSDDRLKRTPFILAAESLRHFEALAIKTAGVDSFLLKPFNAEALAKKMDAAVQARPKLRSVPEAPLKKSLSAALGRRFERYGPD